jgi:hypothetical protein
MIKKKTADLVIKRCMHFNHNMMSLTRNGTVSVVYVLKR